MGIWPRVAKWAFGRGWVKCRGVSEAGLRDGRAAHDAVHRRFGQVHAPGGGGTPGLATAHVLWMLSSTFTFAPLLSTATDHPFSSVAGGGGLGPFPRALDNLSGLHALSPWLPVTDAGTTLWTGFFTSPIRTAGLAHAALVQGAYAGVFLIAAVVDSADRTCSPEPREGIPGETRLSQRLQ